MKLGIVTAVVGAVAAATASAALAAPSVSAPTGAAGGTSPAAQPVKAEPATAQPVKAEPATAQPVTARPDTAQSHRPPHGRTVRLTAADNGRTIRVARGEQIDVTLAVKPAADDATTMWHPIAESGRALTELSPPFFTPRGVTEARYLAAARGKATLTSSRAVCPQHPGAPSCHAMLGWRVTVRVR
jgi:hypothetical protein